VTLFVEGGRGSTQFVVVDSSGTVLHKAYADGFPKEGEVSYDRKRAAAQQVHAAFGDQITLIVAFGALWYMHEANGAPVLADKAVLPETFMSCGRDFPMGFLTESFQDTKMTVIRNVTTPDGKLRKITWGGGLDAPFIDLGSGKAALVDPETGAQSQNTDLPNGVPEIAALLKTMVATAQASAPKVLRSRANDVEAGAVESPATRAVSADAPSASSEQAPLMVDAVAAALLSCASSELLEGATLYTTRFPSNTSTKMIVQAGIKNIVFCSDRNSPNSKGAEASRALLEQVGIQCHKFSPSRPTIQLTIVAPGTGVTAPGSGSGGSL
jgi:deoxycytidylate deaminase